MVDAPSRIVLALLVAAAAVPDRASAQTFRVSGSVAAEAAAYGVSGRPARRPDFVGETVAQLQLQAGGFQTGVRAVLSTDESSTRQQVSQLGLNGSWAWGEAGVGYVPLDWARFGVSGVSVLGAALTLRPGSFLIGFGGGRIQRAAPGSGFGDGSQAVPGALGGPALERWLWAGRLGVGKRDASHFHLTGSYGTDRVGEVAAPGRPKPAQNLSISPGIGVAVRVGEGQLRLRTEGTVSIYTRDTNSASVDIAEWPLADLFPLRESTAGTGAAAATLGLDWPSWGLQTEYERVQPGFQSMGVPYTRDDQEIVSVRPRVRIAGRLDLDGGIRLQRNNLGDTRSSTQERRQADLRMRWRPGKAFTLTASTRQMESSSVPTAASPAAPLQRQEHRVMAVQVAPTLNWRSGGLAHVLVLSTTYQELTDRSPAVLDGSRPGAASATGAVNTAYTMSTRTGAQVGLSVNTQRTEGDLVEIQTAGGTISGALPVPSLRLRLSPGVSLNRTQLTRAAEQAGGTTENTVLSGSLTAALLIDSRNSITLRLRGSRAEGSAISFREGEAALRYERRF